MKIIKTHSESSGVINCAGGKCPSLHVTDDGRVIVQGIRLSLEEKALLTVPGHEDAIAMDLATFRALAVKLTA